MALSRTAVAVKPHDDAAIAWTAPDPQDAIALLKAGHEAVCQLFAAYDAALPVASKQALVAEICRALRVHAQIEEEIFYPEVKSALRNKALVPQAQVEHDSVKALIAQLQRVAPDGASYDAQVKLLGDHVRHQVRSTCDGLFPQAKATSLDMIDIGARMSARQDDLLARLAA